MSWGIQYAPLAEEDLLKAYRHIAYFLRAPENAAEQTMRIIRAVRSLEEMPQRHRLYDDEPWHSQGLRVMPVDNYIILYWLDTRQKTVHIARIMYGRMNVSSQLDTVSIPQ